MARYAALPPFAWPFSGIFTLSRLLPKLPLLKLWFSAHHCAAHQNSAFPPPALDGVTIRHLSTKTRSRVFRTFTKDSRCVHRRFTKAGDDRCRSGGRRASPFNAL